MYWGKEVNGFFKWLIVFAMIGMAASSVVALGVVGWAGYELIHHVSWH